MGNLGDQIARFMGQSWKHAGEDSADSQDAR